MFLFYWIYDIDILDKIFNIDGLSHLIDKETPFALWDLRKTIELEH